MHYLLASGSNQQVLKFPPFDWTANKLFIMGMYSTYLHSIYKLLWQLVVPLRWICQGRLIFRCMLAGTFGRGGPEADLRPGDEARQAPDHHLQESVKTYSGPPLFHPDFPPKSGRGAPGALEEGDDLRRPGRRLDLWIDLGGGGRRKSRGHRLLGRGAVEVEVHVTVRCRPPTSSTRGPLELDKSVFLPRPVRPLWESCFDGSVSWADLEPPSWCGGHRVLRRVDQQEGRALPAQGEDGLPPSCLARMASSGLEKVLGRATAGQTDLHSCGQICAYPTVFLAHRHLSHV